MKTMPQVASVVVFGDRDETTVLGLVVSLMSGKGATGTVDGHAVVVGDASFLVEHGISLGDFASWDIRLAQQGQSVVFVAVDGELAAFFSVVM
jgi:Cu+-exporting ATPase